MQGVEPWRVDLLPLAAATGDHLATYALMDISLDTFPYAGGWIDGYFMATL
jgi:predicted O-linked N-acetylglucosamine transferase (SPINDLY family)